MNIIICNATLPLRGSELKPSMETVSERERVPKGHTVWRLMRTNTRICLQGCVGWLWQQLWLFASLHCSQTTPRHMYTHPLINAGAQNAHISPFIDEGYPVQINNLSFQLFFSSSLVCFYFVHQFSASYFSWNLQKIKVKFFC